MVRELGTTVVQDGIGTADMRSYESLPSNLIN